MMKLRMVSAAASSEEKLFLRPLPVHPYELATWKVATVGPSYHIAVDRMNYSVPFEYIRQKVDVRITRSTIEVFYNGNRICSHRRLYQSRLDLRDCIHAAGLLSQCQRYLYESESGMYPCCARYSQGIRFHVLKGGEDLLILHRRARKHKRKQFSACLAAAG